jgi:hypothetical protein
MMTRGEGVPVSGFASAAGKRGTKARGAGGGDRVEGQRSTKAGQAAVAVAPGRGTLDRVRGDGRAPRAGGLGGQEKQEVCLRMVPGGGIRGPGWPPPIMATIPPRWFTHLVGGLSFFMIHLTYIGGLVAGSHNISPVRLQWALNRELGSCYPGCYPTKILIDTPSSGRSFQNPTRSSFATPIATPT